LAGRAELIGDLGTLPPDTFASTRIFEAVPHVFRDDLRAYVAWKTELGELIDVDPRALCITGSAGIGISLNPAKGLREFNDSSDVDVAVVSPFHFELGWRALRALGSRRLTISSRQRQAIKDHKGHFIYLGTLATDRILELLPFGRTWLSALSHMAGVDPTAGREINARIYRDFDSLRTYQLDSVVKAQQETAA
jgi:hypothetical protein